MLLCINSAVANSAERQPSVRVIIQPFDTHFMLVYLPKIRLITDIARKACGHSQMRMFIVRSCWV